MNSHKQAPLERSVNTGQMGRIETPIADIEMVEDSSGVAISAKVENLEQSAEQDNFGKNPNRINWGALFFPLIWAIKYRVWKWATVFALLAAALFAMGLFTDSLFESQDELWDAHFAERDALREVHRAEQDTLWDTQEVEREALWDAQEAERDILSEEHEAALDAHEVEWDALLASQESLWLGLGALRICIVWIYFAVSILFALRANRIVLAQDLSIRVAQNLIQGQKVWIICWLAWQVIVAVFAFGTLDLPSWMFSLLLLLSATPVAFSSVYWLVHSYVAWYIPEEFEFWYVRNLLWEVLPLVTYGTYAALFLRDRKQQ
ncbi:MAG: hypothetical protein FWC86_01570 [Coriobacteriia bacterium]|nr:hypothetical protein [Coriobacteriia bacterium]